MRIEIFSNGDHYTIIFKGQITRNKAIRILDIIELLGGMSTKSSGPQYSIYDMTKIEKVRIVAQNKFPLGWFSSKDLQSEYEKQFNEPIRLSTASTYLSRLTERGFFIRKGSSKQLLYRTVTIPFNNQIYKDNKSNFL